MASTHRDEISRLELLYAAHPDGLVFPHLADAYRRAGRYAQAESVLDAGLRRHSDYSSAHVVLGRLRLDQGKKQEAESAFRKVLQLDPQNQVALDYLGGLAARDGRVEEALGYLRRLSRLKTDETIAARVRELESRLGGAPVQGPAADEGSEPSDGTGPHDGRSAPGDGTRATADSARSQAAPSNRMPEPGEVVTETMAELYARQGLYERAAAVYRQLLSHHPDDTRLRSKLRLIERELHRPPRNAGRPLDADARPDPRAGTLEDRAERSIRSHLGGILGWSRGGAAPEVSEPEVRGKPLGPGEWPTERLPFRPRLRVETSFSGERSFLTTAAPEEDRPPRERGQPATSGDATDAGSEPSVEPGEGPGGSWTLSAAASAPAVEGAGELDRALAPVGASPDPAHDGPPQKSVLIALTDLLVGLLEYRDPFFRGGSSLTRLLATRVSQELGLSPAEQADLALAAVLRDLGRLALGGRLVAGVRLTPTPEGRRKIERHVDLALQLLEGIDIPKPVRLAVRHHHERWDGAGYPDGLTGEEIPLLARIVAVVDSFAAMVSPRPYRLPRKVPEVARELQEEAGTTYDPAVVEALLRVLGRREQPHLSFVQRHHVLIVNPDQPGALVSAAKLSSAGYLAEAAPDIRTARERLRRVPVAALVVSAEAGPESTTAFVRDLRLDPLFASLPVLVTDARDVETRVKLLENGADICFPPGLTFAELQGTLGALVRRNLRTRARQEPPAPGAQEEAPWLALQGDIQDFPLTWLLQVMKYDSKTAAIGIRTPEDEGTIYLANGDAVHAELRNGGRGEPALRRMLQWRKGRFTVRPDARPGERTITTSIMHLLLTQAVAEDHAAAGVFGAVSAEG